MSILGELLAVTSFTIWGLLPLYWKHIAHVPQLEIIWHRLLWSGVLLWSILGIFRFPKKRAMTALTLRSFLLAAAAGLLLTANWLIFAWAIAHDRTIDSGLGYYICPLVSVLLGVIFLRERLTRLQRWALLFAGAGILYMVITLGIFPWVSFGLAFSFAAYGLFKKQSALTGIHALAVELLLPGIAAVAGMVFLSISGQGMLFHDTPRTTVFLLGTGIITVIPLVLFGTAVKRIRLSDVGFIQYITPSLHVLLAVFLFHEPMPLNRFLGFICVWIGLSLYTISMVRTGSASSSERTGSASSSERTASP